MIGSKKTNCAHLYGPQTQSRVTERRRSKSQPCFLDGMGFRWSGLPNMYFRSLYTCRSQLERISSILLLSSSNRITLCTIRGLLAYSYKRHLFLVSQYGKMTSSCLFFSFYYIGCQVANVSSWSTTFPNNRFHLGEELFPPLTEISLARSSRGFLAPLHFLP